MAAASEQSVSSLAHHNSLINSIAAMVGSPRLDYGVILPSAWRSTIIAAT